MNFNRIIRHIRYKPIRKYLYDVYIKYRQHSWSSRVLPDFLIIGAQKSGTSSLDHYICQHHQVLTPLRNEMRFFDGGWQEQHYDYGEAWYRAHYPLWSEKGQNKVTFDSTPNYIFHPLAAERIFKIMPNVKLIALLRNPVERAVSHYHMSLWKEREHLPPLVAFHLEQERIGKLFEQHNYNNSVFYNNSYLSKGRYAEQIRRYLQFFPIEQILLLPSESFFTDPAQTLRLVFDFIGVDVDCKIKDLAPQNVSKRPKLAFDIYEYLEDYFREHNQALYRLVGRDFGW